MNIWIKLLKKSFFNNYNIVDHLNWIHGTKVTDLIYNRNNMNCWVDLTFFLL